MSATVEATSSDVVRIVEQYLKENGFRRALIALQEESSVYLNTVDNKQKFLEHIRNGAWDRVLHVVGTLQLPRAKLENLYELIVLELLQMREIETARAILRRTKPMVLMRQESPERYLRLEHLLTRSTFQTSDLYGEDNSRAQRREAICTELASEVSEVPGARLLTLIGQALKYQKEHHVIPTGGELDLFRGVAKQYQEDESYVTVPGYVIKMIEGSHAECAVFTPDGRRLVTGSFDGYIEVWQASTGTLALDLEYQRNEKFMSHEAAVLCLSFSLDGQLLVSGCQSGRINVWQLSKGKCLRKFPRAHAAGVTSVRLEGTRVISCSFDNTVRIHGVQSGKTLKIFRGHASYVQCAFPLQAVIRSGDADTSACIMSAGSDGTIRLWDESSTDCVRTLTIGAGQSPVTNVQPHPSRTGALLACDRTQSLHLIDMRGRTLAEYALPPESKAIIQCMSFSPSAKWIYAAADDGNLYCWDAETTHLIKQMKLHEKEVLGLLHHPTRNSLVSWAEDGTLRVWTTPKALKQKKNQTVSTPLSSADDASSSASLATKRKSSSISFQLTKSSRKK